MTLLQCPTQDYWVCDKCLFVIPGAKIREHAHMERRTSMEVVDEWANAHEHDE